MDYKEITGSFNVNSFNTTITDGRKQVLQWLSPVEPQKRHQYLRGNRLKGVGQWIFRTDEFRRWNTREDGSSHSVLFCHGDPGVGKTHLSSVVIDHFYGGRQDIAVAGLYCDYLDRNEQTTSGMLGAMLKQLVGGGDIPEGVRKAFEGGKKHFGGVGPEVPDLLEMLKTAIAQRQRVVICIDGLDESLPAHRAGLLRALRSIVRKLPNVRLFLTGRSFIGREVERYFRGMDTILVSPTRGDTEAFLKMKLDGDTEPDAMDDHLRADIMEIIPNTISEIFLLVSLSIEAVLGETTIHRRREKLKQMSSGQDVGDVYTVTLERIQAQMKDRARLGMEAIMWVAYSERPLEPDELCQALGVETGSRDLNSDNVPSLQTILNCGQGLVTVDSWSSKVRLVHFTLQEHILVSPTLFCNPHSMIAEACLTYLNFGCIKDLSPALSSPPPTTPFLEYASCYWGAHARKETSACIISLALKILNRFDTHISCKLLLLKEFELGKPFDDAGNPIGFTGLHCCALLGVSEIMISLLKVGRWDFNATDLCGHTVLVLATRKGQDGIVKVLLGQEGVNPDMADSFGKTPLSWAVDGGYEEIAEMLLELNDVDPNTRDGCGRTPLSRAVENGCERIVKMLLQRGDVDPGTADEDGRTPFSWAAGAYRAEIVAMLLERNDVNPNTADKGGQTPFSWAAWSGSEEIVNVLLERSSINPDSADGSGRTPLSWAAMFGHRMVARMLLERSDVNPDAADKSGRTPLSWAAWSGSEEIVKMLLERNDVDLNSADGSGRTPFSWAAMFGHWGVVKMLLQRKDSNPNAADKSGRTPLSWAAWSGSKRIVKVLLRRSDVNPDAADKSGRTPLSWAAWNGSKRVVKMLLDQNNVDPNIADKSGRTPVSWAAERGHKEIVHMLLERGDVIPDKGDGSGRTLFPWPTENGRTRAVPGKREWRDPDPISRLKGGLSEPPQLSEPPRKKTRRF